MAIYKRVLDGLTKVGDVLIVHNEWTGNTEYKITRVTKTLTKSLRISDGYEYTFKRDISGVMAHPYVRHNRSSYKVYREAKDVKVMDSD